MTDIIEMKQRAARLMAGNRDARNLDRLFAWLRFRPSKQHLVKDIGNFAAHGDERDQGIAWEAAGHFAAIMQFHVPRLREATTKIPPKADLGVLTRALRGALQLSSPAAVKKDTGIGKTRAIRTLDSAVQKILAFDGTNIVTEDDTTELERKLIHVYSSRIIGTSIFNDRALATELAECLVRNSVIRREQAPQIVSQREFIGVFAIEKMHRSRLLIDGGLEVVLQAGTTRTGALEVAAAIPAPGIHGAKIAFPIFSTECKADDWCSPDIWHPSLVGRPWEVPLELDPNGKLVAVG